MSVPTVVIAALLMRALGLALVVASITKAVSVDWRIGGAGSVVDFDRGVMESLGAAEIAVGLVIAVFPRNFGVPVVGCAIGLGLLAVHGWMLFGTDAPCNCFGAIAVPESLSVTIAAFGVISGTMMYRRGTLPWRWLSALVALLVAVVGSISVAWISSRVRSEADGRIAMLASKQAAAVILVVVGASECDRCKELVAECKRLGVGKEQLVMIWREGDDGSAYAVPYTLIHIAEAQWWSLVGSSAPTVWSVVSGHVTAFGSTFSVRDLRALFATSAGR